MTDEGKPRKLLSTRALCERWDVVDRTIDRRVESGILPEPMWISGRKYWTEAEIEAVERAAVGARPPSGSAATRFRKPATTKTTAA